jgi:hypothetical protein
MTTLAMHNQRSFALAKREKTCNGGKSITELAKNKKRQRKKKTGFKENAAPEATEKKY